MKSIFEESTFTALKERLSKLDENSEALWGKMTIGQMLWHCQGPLNIILGYNDYDMKPSLFAKLFFKKSLYNDKLWRKNLPTAKFLKTTDDKDFITEKTTLEGLIDDTYAQREKTEWQPHPAFGYFTAQQWGQMQYKHLDHHLRQFGV